MFVSNLCLFLFLLNHSVQCITFLEGPSDVHVALGDEAQFNCTYNGTDDLPAIIINGTYRRFANLPARHTFDSMKLTVTDVQPSDNGTRYQCTFPGVNSSVGRIIIIGESYRPCYDTHLSFRSSKHKGQYSKGLGVNTEMLIQHN